MALAGTRQPMVLEVSPKELRFTGNGEVHADANLSLYNPTDKRVAFKVKTTAPRRYCVRPNSGVVEPLSTAKVGIVYQPVDDPQISEISRHKFLIQSLIIDPNEDVKDELWRTAAQKSPEVIMETKMRVVFPDIGESGGDSINHDQSRSARMLADSPVSGNSVGGKKSPTDNANVQRLSEENRRLKDENNTIKDENKLLRADRNDLTKLVGKQGGMVGGVGAAAGVGAYGGRRAVTINEALLSLQVQMVMLIVFVLGVLFGKVFI